MGTSSSKIEFKNLVLEEEIGKGAFGVVKRAHHKVTRKKYAVKMTDISNPKQILRAGAEQRMLQEVRGHVNVVQYYDFAIDPSEFKACLVMEYCDGLNLNDSCVEQWPDQDTSIKYCGHIAAGLDHLHSHQIAHSDLKPDNVVLHRGVCKITDLGVAKAFQTALGATNFAFVVSKNFSFSDGRPVFWAPELIDRIINNQEAVATGNKCDVFSLGLIALVLFTREVVEIGDPKKKVLAPLIDRKAYGQCNQQDIDTGVNGMGAPQKVRDIIRDMLRKDALQRATAEDACEMLKTLKCCIL